MLFLFPVKDSKLSTGNTISSSSSSRKLLRRPLRGLSGAVQCTIIQKLKERAKKTNKKFGLGETKKVCLELLAEAGAG